LALLEEVKQHDVFCHWKGCDASDRPSSAIALLLVGSFCYLGHGLTFDNPEEFMTMH